MLVSATEMLKKAKAGHYAVGQFNINNLEWTKNILLTAKEMRSPVILGVSEGAGKYMTGFGTVAAMDNTPIKVTVGELSKQEAKTLAGAAGVAIGSMIVLGPVGIVGGAFVKGKSITIPAGSQTFVQTASEAQVVGVVCEVKD